MTLSYLRPRERPSEVTAKEGVDVRHRNEAPWLLWFLLGLTFISAVWFGLSLAGMTPVTYAVRWTVYGAAFWAVVNAVLLAAAINRIHSDRFATDRRTGVSQRLDGEVLVDGSLAQLIDISIGGALLRVQSPINQNLVHTLSLEFSGDESVSLQCQERSRQTVGTEGDLISFQFTSAQDVEIGRLAVALFGVREPSVALT